MRVSLVAVILASILSSILTTCYHIWVTAEQNDSCQQQPSQMADGIEEEDAPAVKREGESLPSWVMPPVKPNLTCEVKGSSMAILTATDSPLAVQDLISSVLYHEPCIPLIVYGLDLSPEQEAELLKIYPGRWTYRPFDMTSRKDTAYHPMMKLPKSHFPWLPLILEEVSRTTEYTFWMSPEQQLYRGLGPVIRILEDTGFYSVRTGKNPARRLPRNFFYYAGEHPVAFVRAPQCDLSFFALKRSKAYWGISLMWKECALVPDCYNLDQFPSRITPPMRDAAFLSAFAVIRYGLRACMPINLSVVPSGSPHSGLFWIVSLYDLPRWAALLLGFTLVGLCSSICSKRSRIAVS